MGCHNHSDFVGRTHTQQLQRLEFQHLFAAEADPRKQQFILRNHRPMHLFRDCLDLSRAEAYSLTVDVLATIAAVEFFFAGFSCKTVSMYNAHTDVVGNAVMGLLRGKQVIR